jgi:hypothetical protein
VVATGAATVGGLAELLITPRISVEGSGTGAAATTVVTCDQPAAPFTGFGQRITAAGAVLNGGPLAGNCVRSAEEVTQALVCREARGGEIVERRWTLVCGSGQNQPVVAFEATSNSTTPNSLLPILIRVTRGSSAPIEDGTNVTLQVLNPAAGLVSAVSPTPTLAERVTNPTVGGVANFRFHSRAIGNVVLRASIQEGQAGTPVTADFNLSVIAGPPSDSRLTINPVTTTLPINPNNVLPFVGSPYMAEATITWRRLDGALIVAPDARVTVSVNPVNPTGGFSTLDDPSTPDINEFLVRLGQGPVNVLAGRATVFFHAFNQPATAVMTVAAVDPQLGETVFATQQFTIQSGAPALPASVVVAPVNESPIFVQGGNGPSTKQFEARVFDGAAALVPNPPVGVNNLRIELFPGAQGGDRLRAVNAAGSAVEGPTIEIRSLNGVGSFVYLSGTRAGFVTVKAIADRADNNVDNGIQDAVSSTRQLFVSDGVPFDVVLTAPTPNSIVVNPGASGVTPPSAPGGGPAIPPSPDGTYSLTVSALVTDRSGNPVPAGTLVRFGVIDSPQSGGRFDLAGADGNPLEGGTAFNAPSGQFTTAGGGAGPGDILLLFGKAVPGNRDLEGARVVSSVASATALTVRDRFNSNDDTGSSVDGGPVVPYIIGRSTTGNVRAFGITNDVGVARTILNYPVSRLGRLAAIWAETNADVQQGTAEVAADVSEIRYVGVAPATLTAAPVNIVGNRTTPVTVCVFDALGEGLEGIFVNFSFVLGGSGGSGNIEGVSTAGRLPRPTGGNGCVTVQATTTGVQSNTGEPRIEFSIGGAPTRVNISVGTLVLQAIPSAVLVQGEGVFGITLRLLDGNGGAIAGAQLTGSCTATGGSARLSLGAMPTTNGDGEAAVAVTANGFTGFGTSPSGTCTFATASGSPTATVRFVGIDVCTLGDPIDIPGCPGFQPPGTLTVSSQVVGGNPSGTVFAVPGGLACDAPGNTGLCSNVVRGSVNLSFATTDANTCFCRWAGCTTVSSPAATITVPSGGSISCTAVIAQRYQGPPNPPANTTCAQVCGAAP